MRNQSLKGGQLFALLGCSYKDSLHCALSCSSPFIMAICMICSSVAEISRGKVCPTLQTFLELVDRCNVLGQYAWNKHWHNFIATQSEGSSGVQILASHSCFPVTPLAYHFHLSRMSVLCLSKWWFLTWHCTSFKCHILCPGFPECNNLYICTHFIRCVRPVFLSVPFCSGLEHWVFD